MEEKLTEQELALFLGQNCEISTINYTGLFSSIPVKVIIDTRLLNDVYYNSQLLVTPYLTRLRDMNKTDAKELIKLNFLPAIAIHNVEVFAQHIEFTFGRYKDKASRFFTQLTPEQFRFLLKKGYDVFNWIDKGLAKDKLRIASEALKDKAK